MKITHVDDYIDALSKKFPDVPEKDLKRIVTYGWKLFYLINSYGGDLMTRDEDGFWMYVGRIYKDSLEHFKNYINKLALKIRILYKRKKVKWDGYYYFALSDIQWNNYLALIHRKGRPRKNFTFDNVLLYKILDECKIRESSKKHIFRVPYITDLGFVLFNKEFITDRAELIITREPLKFKDILVSENNYEILNGSNN